MIIHLIDTAIHMVPYVIKREYVTGKDGFNLAPNQIGPGAISMMYQVSTGTRVSMDAAANFMRCNRPTSIENLESTSAKKGESIKHTVIRLRTQARINFFAIRSRLMGLNLALSLDADKDQPPQSMLKHDVSFINAGEGDAYHPTQVLLDMLCWIIWKLFRKEIEADGASSLYHSNLLAAVGKFCQRRGHSRRRTIGRIIDNLTICFGGDMESRILFDYLSLSRGEGEDRKFGLKFILAAPEWAMPDDLYLQGVEHTTSEDFHPNLPADIFYRLRFRFEDRPQEMHELIGRTAREFQIDTAFLERCRTRKRRGVSEAFAYEALPIDQHHPSIAPDAEDHPNLLCWLQAWCAPMARMAAYKCGYDCWSTEEAAEESRWLIPKQQPAELIQIRDPISLKEYIRQWQADDSKAQDFVRMFGISGGQLDHVPKDQGSSIKRMLRAEGYEGQIIVSDRVTPRDGGEPKDMMWFPGEDLYEWSPQMLTIIDFLTQREITWNVFNVPDDSFLKYKVNPVGRTVGVFRCPSGVNKRVPGGPECIDGHQDEISTESIFDLSGLDHPRSECLHCGHMHTAGQMWKRLLETLPAE